ncbi:thioesterase [Streptacidiphilus sp. 4-A2]|nr:thioesterase [Streptacidiphilus sp. 4-A2]
MFRGWPAALPADIEVLTVQLPGREVRIAETPLTDYREAVTRCFTALRPLLDRPYALFGHSMGALLAYGVAVTARRMYAPSPQRLLVSGCAGPGSRPDRPARGQWSDAELVEDLRELGGTPEGCSPTPRCWT